MSVVPFREGFENVKAFLLHIAEDNEIVGFCAVIHKSVGPSIPVQINCTRGDLAFSAALLTQLAIENNE